MAARNSLAGYTTEWLENLPHPARQYPPHPKRTRVLFREPLITPNENEREGYVPNVVYSCPISA